MYELQNKIRKYYKLTNVFVFIIFYYFLFIAFIDLYHYNKIIILWLIQNYSQIFLEKLAGIKDFRCLKICNKLKIKEYGLQSSKKNT